MPLKAHPFGNQERHEHNLCQDSGSDEDSLSEDEDIPDDNYSTTVPTKAKQAIYEGAQTTIIHSKCLTEGICHRYESSRKFVYPLPGIKGLLSKFVGDIIDTTAIDMMHGLFSDTLCCDSISNDDISLAESILTKFVSQYEEPYGLLFMSTNVHALLHVADSVRKLALFGSHHAFLVSISIDRVGLLHVTPTRVMTEESNDEVIKLDRGGLLSCHTHAGDDRKGPTYDIYDPRLFTLSQQSDPVNL
ncbi:hypothetical protein B566_EDAN016288 [Ephemera danica]|nr:hypothetical protein B566_EDAN016288 [Ephemera danica]